MDEGFEVGVCDGAIVGFGELFGVKIEYRLLRLTLPKPVAGSQPVVALKPAEQQVTTLAVTLPSAQHEFVPDTMSLKADGFAYKVGLMKPTVESPAAWRFELTSDTMESKKFELIV